MKTYRQQINAQLRRHPWLVPFVLIFAAVLIGGIFIRLDLIWLSIAIALPVAAWGIYATWKLGKCPKCDTELFTLFGFHTKIYISRSLLPERVKFCPICGLDFDQPYPEHACSQQIP